MKRSVGGALLALTLVAATVPLRTGSAEAAGGAIAGLELVPAPAEFYPA